MNLERFSYIASSAAAITYLLKEALVGGRTMVARLAPIGVSVVQRYRTFVPHKIRENDVAGVIMIIILMLTLIGKVSGKFPKSTAHPFPECAQYLDCEESD
jgi:hypothetical protein